jgi:uncharacterized repeat protein (TIGR01451 family)
VANVYVFDGIDPNGAWSLFVVDDTAENQGAITGGWSLSFASATPIADVAVSGTAEPMPVSVNSNVTFVITLTNQGPALASGIVLTNLLPANTSFVSAKANLGSCAVVAGGVRCDLGSLFPGDTTQITVVAQVNSDVALTNRVAVGVDLFDPQKTNNAVVLRVPTTVAIARSRLTDISFSLEFFGSANRPYRIEASTNLIDWTDQGPATALPNGRFEFVDPGVAGFPMRFYRVLAP